MEERPNGMEPADGEKTENGEKRQGKMGEAADWYAEQWQWQQQEEQKKIQRQRQRRNALRALFIVVAILILFGVFMSVFGSCNQAPEDAFFSVPSFGRLIGNAAGI